VLPLEALAPGAVGLAAAVRTVLALRRRRLHAAAVCSDTARAAALAYFAGVPRRAGLASGPRRAFFSDPVTPEPGENRAAAWLRLATALGIPVQLHQPAYDPGPEARRVAEERLVGSGFETGRPMVALAPGNGFADPLPAVAPRAMSWEPERFAHLCNQLTHRHGAGIVVLGTESDREMAEAVLLDVESPVLDLCGELSRLDEVAAVLERCDLLIGGDSPLLHLAAAVGTASVGLFGPTDGRRRGPYGSDHRVVQAVQQSDRRRPHMPGVVEQASVRQIRVDDVLAGIEVDLAAH
jgi:ADP-heptose:LPS heptosyltransferase